MGGDSSSKSPQKHLSTEKKHKHEEKDPQHKRDSNHEQQRQHTDYSKLEGGENPRISPDDLSELVAEADIDKLEQYGGVEVTHSTLPPPLSPPLSPLLSPPLLSPPSSLPPPLSPLSRLPT
jgi:hypothetical protein